MEREGEASKCVTDTTALPVTTTGGRSFTFGGWKRQQRPATNASSPFSPGSSTAHAPLQQQDLLLEGTTTTAAAAAAAAAVQGKGVLADRQADEPSGPQLRAEGSDLAEAGRYREALAKWEHALLLTPDDPLLFELKAQVLMEEERWWAAVLAATRATELDPQWADGFVTRGRAELNYGEVELAITSFETALGLLPSGHDSTSQVRDELAQANTLHTQKLERERATAPIDYDALKYMKRKAIINEQNQREQHGERQQTADRSESEGARQRGAARSDDDDGGQDPRTLWATVRQVGEASMRERRRERSGGRTDFVVEFDSEGDEGEGQMDVETQQE